MLITGVVSSRIGPKRTLLLGLVGIIAGAGLAGMSDTVAEIVGWRALWGLGNALFIATALATIVNSAQGSVAQAIIPVRGRARNVCGGVRPVHRYQQHVDH